MKRRSSLLLRYSWRTWVRTVAGPGIVACILATPGAAQLKQPAMEDLRWITGGWGAVVKGRNVEEYWTEPASNAMLGMGRTLANGRMVAFEFLRIETRPAGIFYVAQPMGQPPTDFRLTSWDGHTAIFENPEHDFPKRLLYTRKDDGSIDIRVDGGARVADGAESYTYRRLPGR